MFNFHNKMREGSENYVTEHYYKDYGLLNKSRMEHLPHGRNVDWRDLPNVVTILDNGERTEKL